MNAFAQDSTTIPSVNEEMLVLSLVIKFSKQILHLISRKRRQHLPQFPQLAPFFPVISNVLQQQLLVRLAVQSTLAHIDLCLTDVPVELAG